MKTRRVDGQLFDLVKVHARMGSRKSSTTVRCQRLPWYHVLLLAESLSETHGILLVCVPLLVGVYIDKHIIEVTSAATRMEIGRLNGLPCICIHQGPEGD